MMELGTIAALGLSVASAVAIIVCNKYLISVTGFKFATSLTGLHMVATFLWLYVARHLAFFEAAKKPPSLSSMLGFGLLNSVCIGSLNLSLGFNSVGFYQMTKLAIIPTTAILQTAFLSARFSIPVLASLFVLLLGVGIATVSDLTVNVLGASISAVAVLSTSLAQIFTNTMQKNQSLTSTQLLFYSSVYQAVTLCACGPPLDDFLTGESIFKFQYTQLTIVLIAASCVVAIIVNFSNFLVIGKTSPISFQVLGHLKTCLILGMGCLVFGEKFNVKSLGGILLALCGMVAYSYFKVVESSRQAPQAVPKDPPKQTA